MLKPHGVNESFEDLVLIFSSRRNKTKKTMQRNICFNNSNHFVCSFKKNCALSCGSMSLLEVFSKPWSFESFVYPGRNLSGREMSRGKSSGGNVRVGVFFFGGKCRRGSCPGGTVLVGSCPGENCPGGIVQVNLPRTNLYTPLLVSSFKSIRNIPLMIYFSKLKQKNSEGVHC